MTNIELLDDVTVTYIDHMGDDSAIAQAARVSVVGQNHDSNPNLEADAKRADKWAEAMKGMSPPEQAAYLMNYFQEEKAAQEKKDAGLINYLAKERHGSPFEHTSIKFYVEAPIFVFREFQRHRIASYNEMSGRYTKLPPRFYVPKDDRPLVNVGTSARPKMAPGSDAQYRTMAHGLKSVYREAWEVYEDLIEEGVANEVARAVLPVGIMSQMYVTMNLRATFNFLSLRTSNEEATFVSRPQHEIELVAKKIEAEVERLFPSAYAAWNNNGRVAP